jgi:tyrosine-specific transport protein
MRKDFWFATSILAGTIVGAGIFSLPYIFSRLGLLTGLFYLIAFTFIYYLVHIMYGEVLRTEGGNHQFFYLARKYFNRPLADFSSFVILGELVFVMLVYLVLAPTFAEIVFGSDGLIIYVLGFWFFGSLFIFVRLSILELADLFGILSILMIISLVIFLGGGELVTPAFQKLDTALFFLPFGPLLFSLSGRPAMHKVVEIQRQAAARGENFSLAKVSFWGTMIPGLIYFLFVLSVLRLNPAVSPESLNSLGFLSPPLLILLGILGLITLWTSYFMIGINVKDILRLDLKRSFWFSALFVVFVPLLLYFSGFRDFLAVITFTGSVFLAFEGIFVIMLWRRVFPTHRLRFYSPLLYLVFLAALGYEFFSFFLNKFEH